MNSTDKLLLENKAWAQEKLSEDPGFFKRLAKDQTPEFLWIGCSDSRVPANEVTNTLPGELFVHRNIANMVVHTDMNVMSVLQYAVEALKVKHVIVCGHYGCGGVKAALSRQDFGMLNKWLHNIKDVYRTHRAEIDAAPDEASKLDRMIEFNVREQAQHVAETALVQRAWRERGGPTIHGWVYGLDNGLLKEICSIGPGEGRNTIDPIYGFVN